MMNTKNGRTEWLRRVAEGVTSYLTTNLTTNGTTHVTYPADAIRKMVTDRIGEPPHPNCWGVLFRILGNLGLIRKTNKYVSSNIPSTHGRTIPIYQVRVAAAQKLRNQNYDFSQIAA